MDPIVGTLLLDVARRVGAPILKGVLECHIGGAAGEIGGTIIDAVAERIGVSPADLPGHDPEVLERAVREVEAAAPEILVQWNVQQAQSIALQKAEMDKGEAAWTWAWRPAWMWFLGFLWLFRIVLVPIVDAGLGSAIASAVPLDALSWLTTLFAGLYMGGHTVKDAMAKWMGRPG